jgi:hypothetical protein
MSIIITLSYPSFLFICSYDQLWSLAVRLPSWDFAVKYHSHTATLPTRYNSAMAGRSTWTLVIEAISVHVAQNERRKSYVHRIV